MNYMKIDEMDTANCKGVGVSIFVSGCTLHCPGCFNEQAWDFKAGNTYNQDTQDYLMKLLNRPYIDCFSVLGGEPFEPANAPEVCQIIQAARELPKELKIFIWSGRTYDVLLKDNINKQILDLCNYLIDGMYDQTKRDFNLILRGSSNQRVIDLKATKDEGKIVEVWK